MLKVAAVQHPLEAGLSDDHFGQEQHTIPPSQPFHSPPLGHPVLAEVQHLQGSEARQLWHLQAHPRHMTITCQSALYDGSTDQLA